jgi:hypothetical protein
MVLYLCALSSLKHGLALVYKIATYVTRDSIVSILMRQYFKIQYIREQI